MDIQANSMICPKSFPFTWDQVACLIPNRDENRLQHAVENIRNLMKRQKVVRGYDALEELIIIDVIQRLGVDYYFKAEIHEALEGQYVKSSSWEEHGVFDDDLYETALRFRLMRQERYKYKISPDIFNKFKNDEGKFKEELGKDVKGLLSLFEACQLSMKGEDILDEAAEFSKELLRTSFFEMTSIIANTLKNPFHKSLAMSVLVKSFVSLDESLLDFVNRKDWKDHLLNLQEIDFKMAQMSWRKELVQISRWGEELISSTQLGFARIDPVKWYIWCLGTLPEPNMVEERIELAKSVSFIYIIDIYDVYWTPHQLSLFTEAIHRWDHADTEQLPEPMKVCFKALRDMVKDFSHTVQVKHGWNPEESLQKLWADLCSSFLKEANWAASCELPSTAEYLKNGIVSSGVYVFLGHAFFLLDETHRKTKDFSNNLPTIITSTATIARLWNDTGRHRVKDRDGHDMSYVDCYMNEYKVISEESATEHVSRIISNTWKDLNEEYFSQASPLSKMFREACLNFARMVPIMYGNDEYHLYLRSFKKHLRALLNDSL